MKYIDLFAGIGGFRIAMDSFGHECVFSSEIDRNASEVYKNNFGDNSLCDITKISSKDIPAHDMIVGGFPCQAFSKAGHRKGFSDTRGTLFFEIERIAKYHKPKYLLLENVQSLINHDNGNTYKTIINSLKKMGYITTKKPLVVSPMSFGIPQIRNRVFILAVLKEKMINRVDALDIKIPDIQKSNISKVISKKHHKHLEFNTYQNKVFDAWNEFIEYFEDKNEIVFPIWTFEWFEEKIDPNTPPWKEKFIIRNRELFKRNSVFLKKWYKKWNVNNFRRQDQKLEWNVKNNYTNLDELIVQFRSSGVRGKDPTSSPTLVALNERIVLPGLRRFISVGEAAKLQSFPEKYIFSENENTTLKQLGNAVNVDVIKYLVKELISYE